jgi:hypothetical protein
LQVGATSFGLPRDYNSDGAVDAAQYIVWPKGVGTNYTQIEYNVSSSHFGQIALSGPHANAIAAVPEPATVVMLMFAAASLCLRRRRAA